MHVLPNVGLLGVLIQCTESAFCHCVDSLFNGSNDDNNEDQHPGSSNGGRHGNGCGSGEHGKGGNDGENDDDDPKFGVIIRSSPVYKVPWELHKLVHPIHSLASLPLSTLADDMLVEAVGSVPRCHCCDKERHLMQECPSLSCIKSNERTHHSILCLLSCVLAVRQVTNDTAPNIEEISNDDDRLTPGTADLLDAG